MGVNPFLIRCCEQAQWGIAENPPSPETPKKGDSRRIAATDLPRLSQDDQPTSTQEGAAKEGGVLWHRILGEGRG